jgi:foldase protein PrsA
MSYSKKKGIIRKAVEEERPKITAQVKRGSSIPLVIVSTVLAIVLITVGIIYYINLVAPFHKVIITIDNTQIRMNYLLKRAHIAGADAMTVIEGVTNEQIIKLGASQYGIQVTSEEIDLELRRMATGSENATISASELKAWYRQRLNETGFSDVEYKEIISNGMLTRQLQQYLADKVPTVAEQVHLHLIVVATMQEAEDAKAKLDAGANFADLAREVSIDTASKEKGGDIGWYPKGITDFDAVIFSLDIGEVSQPLAPPQNQSSQSSATPSFYLLMVSEKADARETDPQQLETLKSKVLPNWIKEETKLHEVDIHGLKDGFDSYTNAWINLQLVKGQPESTGVVPLGGQ